MTQGDLLSPKIINLVVDMLLWHWVSMMAATDGAVDPGTEGLGWDSQWLEE